MSILAYCYGPLSTEKSLFCKNFSKSNTDFKLIEAHKVRKKITGSIIPGDKSLEIKTVEAIKEICINILNSNKKQNNVLINGLFLNKQSRMNLAESLVDKVKVNFKKVAIAFIDDDVTECFEKNKKEKELKEITFDTIRSQFLNFKMASTPEEADLLISKVEEYGGRINLEAKMWGKDSTIACDNLKKVGDYIKHIKSF
jgi:hypothetical protein